MDETFAKGAPVKDGVKAWQFLAIGIVMFGFFFTRPLYLAHRDGSATFWVKGILFTGLFLFLGIASWFTDVSTGTHGLSAKGRETLTRKGWTLLLSAGAAGVLLLVLFTSMVHAMGLRDASEGQPLPRPTVPVLPATNDREGQR